MINFVLNSVVGTCRVRIQERNLRSIDVYSGHADANGLVAWIKARGQSGSIFLTHGEPENLEGLKRRLVRAGFAAEQIITTEIDPGYRLANCIRQ